MNKTKKATAIALIFVLAASTFTGCSKGKIQSDKTESSNQSTPKGPIPVKIFANWNPAEPSISDKAWMEAVEKATNTKISYEVPPSSNYTERLNIMIAGGDYADVILFGGPADKSFVDSVNNGIITPITKYVEKSPNLKKYSYDMSWDALKIKGDSEIYGIPRTTIQRADGFLVRADWLDAIGFKIPSDNLITIDQFAEIMTKFTRNDPDKNGKADTYGWTAATGGDGSISPILPYAFGNRGWQKTNGEKYEYMDPQYSREKDTYKKALDFTAKLVKEGVIDPNFASIKSDAAEARFKQGVNGAMGAFAGWITRYQTDASKINPNARLTYINGLKDVDGKFQVASYGTGIWGCWAVTKAAKDPEAVVRIFDWLLSDEGWSVTKYGVEGVTYKKEGDKKVALPEFDNFLWGSNSVRRNDDAEFFVKINMQEEYREPVKRWIDIAIKGNITSMDYDYRPAAADKPELIDYNKQLAQVRAEIILGAAPSSEWDKALDGWYKAGGEEYVKQMNDFIKKTVAKK